MLKFNIFLPIIFMFSFMLFQSCGTEKEQNKEAEIKTYDLNETPSNTQTDDPYLIGVDGFWGLKEGGSIAGAGNKLKEGIMETGEADFDVHYIIGPEGDTLGHVFPDMTDGSLIGDIIITSPKGRTPDGIKVGTTFAELEKKLGELEVHGSEIEGWTSAQKDNYRYGLDIGIWSYEVDKKEIKPDTKVIEISILGDVGE